MPAGRPRKEIDQKQFENLCFLQCTKEEICGFFDVSDATLTRWCRRTYKDNFEGVYKKKSEGGKISLRRAQMRLAEKSAAMAIFLGKNMLGQSDTPDEKGLRREMFEFQKNEGKGDNAGRIVIINDIADDANTPE